MSNNLIPITEIENETTLGGWIFNIRQGNWSYCERGPESEGNHERKHVGEPWHGIKKTSMHVPADISYGDVIFARRASRNVDGSSGSASHGLMAIWRFNDWSRVSPNMHIPWEGGNLEYRHVIYCREEPDLPRSLDTPVQENFSPSSSMPFYQTAMQDSMKRLSKSERIGYINHLLDANLLTNVKLEQVLQELKKHWKL